MEDPQLTFPNPHIDVGQPIDGKRKAPCLPTSPEHSRARSKKACISNPPSNLQPCPRTRRRISDADGTRRGRSRTRSVNADSAKRRSVRRRRSRSPSRSCSTSANEVQSPRDEMQRKSGPHTAYDEHVNRDISAVATRNKSRDSMRSRSKRIKKYRRRSDYAVAAENLADANDLETLRDLRQRGDPTQMGSVPLDGEAQRRPKSCEDVLEEEDEEVNEIEHNRGPHVR